MTYSAGDAATIGGSASAHGGRQQRPRTHNRMEGASMNKQDYLKTWGYLEVLQREYEKRAAAAADNKGLDDDRRRVLVTDYTKWAQDIGQLMIKVQAEADSAQE